MKVQAVIDERGIIVEVEVAQLQGRANSRSLEESDLEQTTYIVEALVDTGSSDTFIDLALASNLALQSSGELPVQRSLHDPAIAQLKQYEISLTFTDKEGKRMTLEPVPVLGSTLRGVVMIIGRDVLSMCSLHYDGIEESAELVFE